MRYNIALFSVCLLMLASPARAAGCPTQLGNDEAKRYKQCIYNLGNTKLILRLVEAKNNSARYYVATQVDGKVTPAEAGSYPGNPDKQGRILAQRFMIDNARQQFRTSVALACSDTKVMGPDGVLRNNLTPDCSRRFNTTYGMRNGRLSILNVDVTEITLSSGAISTRSLYARKD